MQGLSDLERIEIKLDEILSLLGKGRGRTAIELRRKATDDVARLTSRGKRSIRSYEREIEGGKQAHN